jgi:hypothetical protein
MIRPIVLATLCLLLPIAARASPADEAATKLFADTCLHYPDDVPRLRVYLDTHLTRAETANEEFFLGKRSGAVWLSRSPDVNMAVIVLDSGACILDADNATVAGVVEAFPTDAADAGFKITAQQDQAKAEFHGAPGKARTYTLQKLDHSYKVKASGTNMPAALLHAELTLEPGS